MKRNQVIIISIIFAGLINIKMECNKARVQNPDFIYKYQFQQKISIEPYQANYHVGDTIFFQMYVPGKKFYDSRSDSKVFFDSASFNMGVFVNLEFNNPYVGDGPFASFIFPPGVSAYTSNYSGTTQAYVTTGCSQSQDYLVTIGAVLIQKGVFSVGAFCNSVQYCNNGYATKVQLRLSLDVDDTHKTYYEGLPFSDIGKQVNKDVLSELDTKYAAVIVVQ